jgi:hypothetical protein
VVVQGASTGAAGTAAGTWEAVVADCPLALVSAGSIAAAAAAGTAAVKEQDIDTQM